MRRSCPGFRTSKPTKENIFHPQSSGNPDAASISGVKTEAVFIGKAAHFVQMHARNAICRIASNAVQTPASIVQCSGELRNKRYQPGFVNSNKPQP
jgi:hypothetical protein